jgi:hypothetical protein
VFLRPFILFRDGEEGCGGEVLKDVAKKCEDAVRLGYET